MKTRSEAKPEILSDPKALARLVTDWLLRAAAAKDGIFAVALSVGLLESSRHAVFLVAREQKRAIFTRFRCDGDNLPAARPRPTGTLWLFRDAAATREAASRGLRDFPSVTR